MVEMIGDVQKVHGVQGVQSEILEDRTAEPAEATSAEVVPADHRRRSEIRFEDEKNYVVAREIMNALVRRDLLTEDEVEEIDTFLKRQFNPIFTALIADYPAFSDEDNASTTFKASEV